MIYDYFVGRQAERYAYLWIPEVIITDERFSELSMEAKVLYGILLKRMTNAKWKRWIDEKNRAYILYPEYMISKDLGINRSQEMSSAILRELETVGLVEWIRQGQGLPSKIYVKNFMPNE